MTTEAPFDENHPPSHPTTSKRRTTVLTSRNLWKHRDKFFLMDASALSKIGVDHNVKGRFVMKKPYVPEQALGLCSMNSPSNLSPLPSRESFVVQSIKKLFDHRNNFRIASPELSEMMLILDSGVFDLTHETLAGPSAICTPEPHVVDSADDDSFHLLVGLTNQLIRPVPRHPDRWIIFAAYRQLLCHSPRFIATTTKSRNEMHPPITPPAELLVKFSQALLTRSAATKEHVHETFRRMLNWIFIPPTLLSTLQGAWVPIPYVTLFTILRKHLFDAIDALSVELDEIPLHSIIDVLQKVPLIDVIRPHLEALGYVNEMMTSFKDMRIGNVVGLQLAATCLLGPSIFEGFRFNRFAIEASGDHLRSMFPGCREEHHGSYEQAYERMTSDHLSDGILSHTVWLCPISVAWLCSRALIEERATSGGPSYTLGELQTDFEAAIQAQIPLGLRLHWKVPSDPSILGSSYPLLYLDSLRAFIAARLGVDPYFHENNDNSIPRESQGNHIAGTPDSNPTSSPGDLDVPESEHPTMWGFPNLEEIPSEYLKPGGFGPVAFCPGLLCGFVIPAPLRSSYESTYRQSLRMTEWANQGHLPDRQYGFLHSPKNPWTVVNKEMILLPVPLLSLPTRLCERMEVLFMLQSCWFEGPLTTYLRDTDHVGPLESVMTEVKSMCQVLKSGPDVSNRTRYICPTLMRAVVSFLN